MRTIVIIIFYLILATTLRSQEKTTSSNYLYVLPINYPFGIAEIAPGHHISIGWEHKLKTNNHWSIHLPVSIGTLKTFFISDYYRKGFNVFLSPGMGYYFKPFNGQNSYHLSGHALLGWAEYNLKTMFNRNRSKDYYYGLLVNNNFQKALSQKLSLVSQLGLGFRLNNVKKNYVNHHTNPIQYYSTKQMDSYALFNFTIGLRIKI